ncbi:MAG: hypothetical protein QOF64_1367 [Candidatus Binatota bacterium]|jgi:hypothetical protein|nr:hypothetical protein [Candidatus Binatota bacterium]
MSVVRENPNANSNPSPDGKLRTADIAGAGKAEAEDFIEVEAVPERVEQDHTPLFSSELNQDFRAQWQNIQTGFVDEPRASVERADELVAQLMQRLAQSFSEQRNELEKQWDASDEISTEELRLALRRYRSFFERLLSI